MIASAECDLDSISEVEMDTGNGECRHDNVQNDARSEGITIVLLAVISLIVAPVVWGIRIQPTFALVRVVRDD